MVKRRKGKVTVVWNQPGEMNKKRKYSFICIDDNPNVSCKKCNTKKNDALCQELIALTAPLKELQLQAEIERILRAMLWSVEFCEVRDAKMLEEVRSIELKTFGEIVISWPDKKYEYTVLA